MTNALQAVVRCSLTIRVVIGIITDFQIDMRQRGSVSPQRIQLHVYLKYKAHERKGLNITLQTLTRKTVTDFASDLRPL